MEGGGGGGGVHCTQETDTRMHPCCAKAESWCDLRFFGGTNAFPMKRRIQNNRRPTIFQ
jgi:hypothetical protein